MFYHFPKCQGKKKASLGRSTKDAKRMKDVRSNEDDTTYSQRLDTEKNRRSIEYLNETSDHYEDRITKMRNRKKLMDKAIMQEDKIASPAVTRGALKRKCVQQNFPSSSVLCWRITSRCSKES